MGGNTFASSRVQDKDRVHVERLEHSIELDSKLNSKDKAVEDKIMEDSESSSSFLCFLNFTRASY